jgi:hypothetical protein
MSVIDFMAGAATMGFLVGALFFLRFWTRTHERLFLAFAVAFAVLAVSQALAQWLGQADERIGIAYLLRILGFALILGGIVDRNVSPRPRRAAKPSV